MSKNTLIIAAIILLAASGLGWFLASQPPTPATEIVARRGLHWHYELAIFINGQKQRIPAGVGLNPLEQPVHTHETDGVIHLEFPGLVTKKDVRLGKFFAVWGKKFSQDCIFEYCTDSGKKVKLLVNGQENPAFENYEVKDGDQVEIRYE